MIRLRKFIQFVFLVALGILIYKRKVQLWMIIFLSSALLTLIFGRFYCGWICSINTLMEFNGWMYKKLKIKRKRTPDLIKSSLTKMIILIIFALGFILNNKLDKNIPILLILIIIAFILSFIYEPQLWHKYLCPFGIILSFIGKYSKKSLNVINDKCVKCRLCKSVCPADAIIINDRNGYPKILKEYCLQCTSCIKICSQNTIKYE